MGKVRRREVAGAGERWGILGYVYILNINLILIRNNMEKCVDARTQTQENWRKVRWTCKNECMN